MAHSTSSSAPSCLLCASSHSQPVCEVPYHEIWTALGRDWKAQFSESVIERHTPDDVARLYRCCDCGLHYFYPPVAGDSEFYRELSLSPLYYSAEKWEFGWVGERIGEHDVVLDIGCGEGGFIAYLQARGRTAVGLETNPEAVERARSAGLDVRLGDVATFSRANPQRFDVVTLFHVLEHLRDIRSFLESAVACVKPGGRFIVSVPYRDRILRTAGVEPLDCPPHHVSRWDAIQLEKLSELLGLSLEYICFQPPDMHTLRAHLRERLSPLFGPGKPFHIGGLGTTATRAFARLLVSKPLYQLYRRTGLLASPRLCPHAVLACFRAAEISCPPTS